MDFEPWIEGFKKDKDFVKTFRDIESSLQSSLMALQDMSEEQKLSNTHQHTKNFNGIVKFCLNRVAPALFKHFKMKSSSEKPPVKAITYKMLNATIRNYLKSMVLLSRSMTDPSASQAILSKGILPLVSFFSQHPRVAVSLIRHLSHLWSTSEEEEVQVLAFLAAFRLYRISQHEVKEHMMKLFYYAYNSNSRFTSPKTLSTISFMRTSLVELYSLDLPLTYKLTFNFIRNMANHLRNAMTASTQEKLSHVHNWPLVHSLHFIGELFAKTHPSPVLQPLIYPWIQIALGALDLQKSPKYVPLHFHLAEILTEFSKRTSVFIPVMPALLEVLHFKVLHSTTDQPKNNDQSENAINWDCIIKASESEIKRKAFADGIIDQLFSRIMAYMSAECATIGFPELAFPAIVQIKDFLKQTKNSAHIKKMKQLLDKIQENSDFISDRRKEVSFNVADTKAVKDWEIATRQSDPPLLAAFSNQRKGKTTHDGQSKRATHDKKFLSRDPEEEVILYDDYDDDQEAAENDPDDFAYMGADDVFNEKIEVDYQEEQIIDEPPVKDNKKSLKRPGQKLDPGLRLSRKKFRAVKSKYSQKLRW